MSNSFYRAFEDRHRGSRELIKSRLSAYLPFLLPLAVAQRPTALDLGCGRGEWLELLGETGFAARGVDLDEGMLAACRERGLDVATEDALASLRAQPDASLALVSAFHLVEHIPFEAVQELITEAWRALQPGGLLIIETPNPENLVVATSGFYMDPSHLRPIPPQLLEFVVEFGGFARHRVVRLQEPPQLHGAVHLELMNVLNGVSPDYGVVAQKGAEPAVTALFDAAFATSFGLELSTLAQRYDAQQAARASEIQAGVVQLFQRTLETVGEAQQATRAIQAELHSAQQRERALEMVVHAQALQEAEAKAADLSRQLEQARQAHAAADAHAQHLQWQLNEMTVRVTSAEQQVRDVHASASWRITRPARAAMTLLRRPLSGRDVARMIAARNKARAGNLFMPLVRNLARRPAARAFAMRAFARFPAIEGRLRSLAYRALGDAPAYVPPAPLPAAEPVALQPGQPPVASAPNMSRSAQNVFSQMQRSLHSDDYPET
jgi:SAM-dependent methyltransferase